MFNKQKIMEKRIFLNFFPGIMINYGNLTQDKTIKYTCDVEKFSIHYDRKLENQRFYCLFY